MIESKSRSQFDSVELRIWPHTPQGCLGADHEPSAMKLSLWGATHSKPSELGARTDAAAATAFGHSALQPLHEILSRSVEEPGIEGHKLEALFERTPRVSLMAAYAIAMDVAGAMAHLCERPGATSVAIQPSDVIIQPSGYVCVLHPALLHSVHGRPLASTTQLSASLFALLRRLLVWAEVVDPDRVLSALGRGRAVGPATLHGALATRLFDLGFTYDRSCIASILSEAGSKAGTRAFRNSDLYLDELLGKRESGSWRVGAH